MRAYIIRRLLLMAPTLLLVSFMVFFLVYLVPGSYIDFLLAQPGTEELDKPALERALGLDAPIMIQYGRWMGFVPQMDGDLNGIFQGNLGESWYYKKPVIDLVAIVWPVTFELGLMGLIIAQLIALP
ncbi:unnamed protein product, partial [marine sediment metagenome]